MTDTGLSEIDHAVQQTHEWLNGVMRGMEGATKKDAYHALRAVLAATRDNQDVTEASHFGAQLPTMVRGLYYEGFRPADLPGKDRTLEQFLERVRAKLPTDDVDAEAASRAVFATMRERLDDGQADAAKNMLNQDVQALWPKGFDRSMPGNFPGSENDPAANAA